METKQKKLEKKEMDIDIDGSRITDIKQMEGCLFENTQKNLNYADSLTNFQRLQRMDMYICGKVAVDATTLKHVKKYFLLTTRNINRLKTPGN